MQTLIHRLEETNSGSPWFGRSVFSILDEIDPSNVYKKPNNASHSMIELLYHMNTWADFTLKRIEKEDNLDLEAFEKLDWRDIDPKVHHWDAAVAEYKEIHKKIATALETKEDDFLEEGVTFRKYNFRFLLNGIMQHDIYHVAQIAYLSKLL
jgi:uncharacterized damage-inducible protein DinB